MNQENSDYLFVCSSKYTCFNSINISMDLKKSRDIKIDLILFKSINDLSDIGISLKQTGIFRNIKLLPFINKWNTFLIFLIFLFPERFLKNFFGKDFTNKFVRYKYKRIYSQNHLYSALFKRIYKDAEVYIIEEGISSYSGRNISESTRSFLFKLVNKLLFRNKLIPNIKAQFLYNPDLFVGDHYCIKKLPKYSAINNKIFNHVFDYKTNLLYKQNNFIYLSTPLKGLMNDLSRLNKIKDSFENDCLYLLNFMFSSIKTKKVIYRSHPLEIKHNQNLFLKHENLINDEFNNMWETEIINSINNNHILISFFSSAAINPKLINDKEPYILFLIDLIPYKTYNSNYLINNLKKLYSNKSKILVPKNLDELREIIHDLEII